MAVLDIMPADPALADQEGRRRLEDRDQAGLARIERPNLFVRRESFTAGVPDRRRTTRRSSEPRSAATDSTPIAPKSTRPLSRSSSKRKCSGRASRRTGWMRTKTARHLDRAGSSTSGATSRASASHASAACLVRRSAYQHGSRIAGLERVEPALRPGERFRRCRCLRPAETASTCSPAIRW